MVSRVRQEVSIHTQLKHPSILELYTFFEDAANVYLVLELAHNGELHRYMKEHQRVMTENETATILSQVVSGLLYLKSQNILHRDMSLSNLLLTKDQQVKIADFGLATQLTRPDEKHMTLCGTPNYISPEVASRAAHGLPVDVWGLGCMMYTLLVGKPPFDTDGIKSTLTKVVMTDFVVPAYLSMDAKDLLNRLLCKNPKERIHIDDVLQHPFMKKYSNVNSYKYNNTLASVDSGLITMSSGTNSTQNITGKLGLTRSRSEDRTQYQHLPMHVEQQHSILRANGSHHSLYDELQNRAFPSGHNEYDGNNVLKRFESMEIRPDSSLFGGKYGKQVDSYGQGNVLKMFNHQHSQDVVRKVEPVNGFQYDHQENQNLMVN